MSCIQTKIPFLYYTDIKTSQTNHMKKILLLIIAISLVALYGIFHSNGISPTIEPIKRTIEPIKSTTMQPSPYHPKTYTNPIEAMLHQQDATLKPTVINTVLAILDCAQNNQIEYNPTLTVIDYSLPANQKRLWVFDLDQKKLLFHTYVSHGIKSGALVSHYFSNQYDSKTSSIGVYKTEKAYYGREGLSLKLNGLEKGFNDHAYNRSLVMHGGWYLDEAFIKKYGRSGRSWGCPAVPEELAEPIIHRIKDNTLLIVYYPDEQWLAKSNYLQCKQTTTIADNPKPLIPIKEKRDDILFIDKMNHHDIAVVAIQAQIYTQLFQKKAPLTRMLRRPIQHQEYIALNRVEFERIMQEKLSQHLYFVMPVITMRRGYYATEMKPLDLGAIQYIRANTLASNTINTNSTIKPSYTAYFDSQKTVQIKSTDHFIRWLGL